MTTVPDKLDLAIKVATSRSAMLDQEALFARKRLVLLTISAQLLEATRRLQAGEPGARVVGAMVATCLEPDTDDVPQYGVGILYGARGDEPVKELGYVDEPTFVPIADLAWLDELRDLSATGFMERALVRVEAARAWLATQGIVVNEAGA